MNRTKEILKHFNPGYLESISEEELLAKLIEYNEKKSFPKESDSLYYLIREPILWKSKNLDQEYEGFCKDIELQSMMKNGIAILDGLFSKEIPFGAIVKMKKSKRDLCCVDISETC